MKPAVLVLMALIPFSLAAQVRSSNGALNQYTIGKAGYADAALPDDSAASTIPEVTGDTGPVPKSDPQGKTGEPGSAAHETSEPQPMGPVPMVGYVDSAIIESQIRIRAEEGFHDTVPDRAEFFYPQCSCTNVSNAPGHNFQGASDNIDFGQIYLYAEYAPVRRLSVFVEVPFRWIEPHHFITGSFEPATPSASTLAGLSDVTAGIRVAIAQTAKHSLTVQLKAYFPSGSGADDLGTGHYSFEPSLLYYQRLSRRWVIESQIGDWHPIGGSTGYEYGSTAPSNFAGDVLLYGIGPSYQLITSERFSLAPVAEMFGWHVFGGLETLPASFMTPTPMSSFAQTICISTSTLISASNPGCSFSAAGINIVNLKAGLRLGFGIRNSVYVGFGQQVTHEGWYKNLVRVEYRYSF